ncbi:MAG: ATP-binding protein [Actinomycetales bacterium]
MRSRLTSVLGRDEDVLAVRGLLAEHRLVCVVGPGGIGKTTLSEQVVADGTAIIDLTAITDGTEIASVVARTLRVAEQSTRSSLDQVLRHVGTSPTLFVLDNCEHVVDGAASFVEDLLAACPEVRVLVTSTVSLGVPGEQLYELPPLTVPAPSDDLPQVKAAAAVQVLVDRTRLAVPEFDVSAQNRAEVIDLCRRLDGLPLAIELAAVRLRALSVAQLNSLLDERFTVLTQGNPRGPTRHQTLLGLVQWSYERCTPAQQRLWARLAVFPGTFSLAAAESVCNDDSLDGETFLDLIDGLISRSVLVVERGRTIRYRQLATIRDFGARLLHDSGEAETLRGRLLDYCVQASREMVDAWCGPRQAAALSTWRDEHPTMLEAFTWAIGQPSRHLQVAEWMVLLRYHWIAGGQLSDGRRRLDQVLSQTHLADLPLGQVLGVAAWVASIQGDREGATDYLDRASRAAASAGDDVLTASIEAWTALHLMFSGDLSGAITRYQQAIDVLESAGEQAMSLTAGFQLAMAQAYAGQDEAALVTCQGVITTSTDAGEQWNLAYALWVRAVALVHQGEYAAAEQAARDALIIQESFEDGICIALVLLVLAWIATARHDVGSARRLTAAALVVWDLIGTSVEAFGPDLVRENDLRGPGPGPVAGTLPTTKLDAVRLGLEHVDLSEPHPPAHADPLARAGLTGRQREVFALLAEGRSNKEIAETLVISARTAEGHVEQILRKLTLTSRAEVAAWHARESGSARGANT